MLHTFSPESNDQIYKGNGLCYNIYNIYTIQYKTLFHSNHIKWTHEFTCTMQHKTIGDKV